LRWLLFYFSLSSFIPICFHGALCRVSRLAYSPPFLQEVRIVVSSPLHPLLIQDLLALRRKSDVSTPVNLPLSSMPSDTPMSHFVRFYPDASPRPRNRQSRRDTRKNLACCLISHTPLMIFARRAAQAECGSSLLRLPECRLTLPYFVTIPSFLAKNSDFYGF